MGRRTSVAGGAGYSPSTHPAGWGDLLLLLLFSSQKTLVVLNPMMTTEASIAGDSDLAGPIVFALAFGSFIMFSGKLYFNYIYGIGQFSENLENSNCQFFNLCRTTRVPGDVRSPQPDVTVRRVLRVCGLRAGLLSPAYGRWSVYLSITASLVLLSLPNLPPRSVSPVSLSSSLSLALWATYWQGRPSVGESSYFCCLYVVSRCTLSSSKLFVTALEMRQQQLLVAYPCALLYGVFALITMF